MVMVIVTVRMIVADYNKPHSFHNLPCYYKWHKSSLHW